MSKFISEHVYWSDFNSSSDITCNKHERKRKPLHLMNLK